MSATASADSIAVIVNDDPRTLAHGATVTTVAAELGLAERKGVAIAVNGTVVARNAWSTRVLASGDRVLVIRATQGG